MKIRHLGAYIIVQLYILTGMVLGYQMHSRITIQTGMVAATAVFMSFSIAEAVAVFYGGTNNGS